MAINVVGYTTATGTGGADVSLDLTQIVGLAQNDLVIVSYTLSNGGTDRDLTMLTSGYTEVADLYQADTRSVNLGVYYKFMGASPDSTAQVEGHGNAGEGIAATATAYRGVKLVANGGPFDTTATTVVTASTALVNPASIDHSGAAGVVVVVAGGSATNEGANVYGFPAPWRGTSIAVNDTNDAMSGMATRPVPADPEDPAVWSMSGADSATYSYAAVTMALAPITSTGIQFLGSDDDAKANGVSPVLSFTNFGLVEGDFVIAAMQVPVASDLDLSAGWVLAGGWTLLGQAYANDTQDTNLGIWGKFMGPTPDADVTLAGPGGGGTEGTAAVCMAFRGVDRTRPLDVVPTSATGTSTVLADPPSITLSGAAGVWTVVVGGGGHNDGSSVAYTGPTGYTLNFLSAAAADTNDSIIGIGYNIAPSATESPAAFTYSTTDSVNDSWAAFTLALRPAETTNIHLVGSTSGSQANGADVTLTLPTCLENDLVIVAGAIPAISDIDLSMDTSGYTEVADLYANDTNDVNMGVFYKKMGSSPDATAVFNGTGDSSDAVTAVALVFRGVDTTTPMDTAATTSTGTNSGYPDPPSIDYSDTNAVIVIAGGSAHSAGNSGGHVFPLYYIGESVSKDEARDVSVSLAFTTAPFIADPENPGTICIQASAAGSAGVVNTNDSWAAVTMALRKQTAGQLHVWVGIIGL